jgi:hypothetical protein
MLLGPSKTVKKTSKEQLEMYAPFVGWNEKTPFTLSAGARWRGIFGKQWRRFGLYLR